MQYQKLHFKEIDSTNSYLKNNHHFLKEFTFVSADYQSLGKGRENRTWLSNNEENLLFSFLLKDQKFMDISTYLSIYSAVEIAKFLESYKIKNVSVKWPNDVLIGEKKVCGILLEAQLPEYIVVGIGLNVNQKTFPPNLKREATSLTNETKQPYSIDEIKEKLFSQLVNNFNDINHVSYLSYFRENNYLMNKKVKARHNQKDFVGEVIGITDDLRLQIKSDKLILPVDSGEITVL